VTAADLRSGSRGVSVSVRRLRHTYGRGRNAVQVLRGLDFDIAAGSHVALQGPSGAGKSTLLSLLGGLEPLREGEIWIGETRLRALRRGALAEYRSHVVGFVFQHFGLLDVLTARENVMLALGLAGVPLGRRRPDADSVLDAVGLSERADHRPQELSGGEQQRVAIARAISTRPRLLLADEPTGNLDEEAASRVLDLLEHLRAENGCTLVVVTHNPAVAERASHRLRLRDGRLEPALVGDAA
jgi:putative ABC transport system ATP-binding protein